MAYRAFDEWQSMAAAEPLRMAASGAVTDAPVFTPAERDVIAVARVDGAASVRPRTWLTRLAVTLFGIAPPNPLANARLEALRRFAVLARVSRGNPPRHEIDAFLAAGFAPRAALTLSHLSR